MGVTPSIVDSKILYEFKQPDVDTTLWTCIADVASHGEWSIHFKHLPIIREKLSLPDYWDIKANARWICIERLFDSEYPVENRILMRRMYESNLAIYILWASNGRTNSNGQSKLYASSRVPFENIKLRKDDTYGYYSEMLCIMDDETFKKFVEVETKHADALAAAKSAELAKTLESLKQ